jgi:hypothetical protein
MDEVCGSERKTISLKRKKLKRIDARRGAFLPIP